MKTILGLLAITGIFFFLLKEYQQYFLLNTNHQNRLNVKLFNFPGLDWSSQRAFKKMISINSDFRSRDHQDHRAVHPQVNTSLWLVNSSNTFLRLVNFCNNVFSLFSNAIRGEDITLECLYDLQGDSLYSVKWYRNGQVSIVLWLVKSLNNVLSLVNSLRTVLSLVRSSTDTSPLTGPRLLCSVKLASL